MTDHPHIGSGLDDFLAEEGILDAATEQAVNGSLAWQIGGAIRARKALQGGDGA